MSFLVFGKSGQVAQELALLPDVICLGRSEADLGQPGSAQAAIKRLNPRAVINAAAYTAVDQAETDQEAAHQLNAQAPGEMARACAAAGIPLVHISTDYVFRGDGQTPWSPGNATDPQNVYGQTKLAGEQVIAEAGGTAAILRTSWVVSAHGANFVKTMLRLGRERDGLTIVADQIGGPTAARDIAAACISIATQLLEDPAKAGIYHYAGAPAVSWADFARAIFDLAGINCAVTDIPSSNYPTPASRPLNSRMNCETTKASFGLPQPDWRASLATILKEL